MLFLTAKIFLGKWLSRGVFPFFNPYIFAGIPFAFDIGMGNFHPLNLLFIFPYPLSFSLWSAVVCFIFLWGYYSLFNLFTKNRISSLLLTLIMFFSGSGFFLRMNNPMILVVIAHYGLFLSSLIKLKNKDIKSFVLPLLWGILMTISGHFQFVLYGYILGIIVGILFFKIKLKKLILFYFLLFLLTSWYYIFSLPLILASTRFVSSQNTGLIYPVQLIQLIIPFIFGEKFSGARWNIGFDTVINVSMFFTAALFFLILKKKINLVYLVTLFFLILLSFGLLPTPLLRNPGQIFVMIHIIGLILLAKNEKNLTDIINRLNKKYLFFSFLIIIGFTFFFYSQLFSKLFMTVYRLLKHNQISLFYDKKTVLAIGFLMGKSFVIWGLFFVSLLFIKFYKRVVWSWLILFIVIEGLTINCYQNYFIPSSIITTKINLPKKIDFLNYRIQSTSDTLPYFGFNIYVDNVYFQPPFSKEKTFFDKQEKKNYSYLKKIINLNPSSWSMISNTNSVQGYATFVPQKMAEFFNKPSEDYRAEYDYIIKRNVFFGEDKKTSHINALDTSKITIYDKRWQEMGVRYFISDRPLKKYKLIYKDDRYFYENEKTLPIFRLVDENRSYLFKPVNENPNEIGFKINKKDLGKRLIININPGGFTAKLDDKKINIKKNQFEIEINLDKEGLLKVYYSSWQHLKEIFPFHLGFGSGGGDLNP